MSGPLTSLLLGLSEEQQDDGLHTMLAASAGALSIVGCSIVIACYLVYSDLRKRVVAMK